MQLVLRVNDHGALACGMSRSKAEHARALVAETGSQAHERRPRAIVRALPVSSGTTRDIAAPIRLAVGLRIPERPDVDTFNSAGATASVLMVVRNERDGFDALMC
jgi:hypothetical protein